MRSDLDCAENPVVMHRLEVLLDLLIAAHWDHPPQVEERLLPRDRQTFGQIPEPVRIRIWAPEETAADWRAAIEAVRKRFGLLLPE